MIDWSRVQELIEEVGSEDFEEVVDLFLEEVNEGISRLRSGPAPDQLESDLHFLKGSALNLGFRHFSSLCQAGESTAASGQPDLVNIPEILTSFEASQAEFLSGWKARLVA